MQLLSKDIQSPREEAFLQLKELNLMLKRLRIAVNKRPSLFLSAKPLMGKTSLDSLSFKLQLKLFEGLAVLGITRKVSEFARIIF